jgi:hypothetical protein
MKCRALLLVPLLAACRTTAPAADVAQTTTVVAIVETAEQQTREVLLRGQAGAQSGRLLTVIAGRGVQRLNEIRPGDRVTVLYFEALAAQVSRARPGPPLAVAAAAAGREVERPGGEVTRVVAARVTITAIDPAAGTVTFVGPRNRPRTVAPKDPEICAFVAGLQVGDQVDLVYEEALAISITPMR